MLRGLNLRDRQIGHGGGYRAPKLQLLESFSAQGSDGATCNICGCERMAQEPSLNHGPERWQCAGVLEYRLEEGALIDARAVGSMRKALKA